MKLFSVLAMTLAGLSPIPVYADLEVVTAVLSHYDESTSTFTIELTSGSPTDQLSGFLNAAAVLNPRISGAVGKIGANIACQTKDDFSVPSLGTVSRTNCEFRLSADGLAGTEKVNFSQHDPTEYFLPRVQNKCCDMYSVRRGKVEGGQDYLQLVIRNELAESLFAALSGSHRAEITEDRMQIKSGHVMCRKVRMASLHRGGSMGIYHPLKTFCYISVDAQGALITAPQIVL